VLKQQTSCKTCASWSHATMSCAYSTGVTWGLYLICSIMHSSRQSQLQDVASPETFKSQVTWL